MVQSGRGLELIKYNVTEIMTGMQKPYCVISGENAWSRPSSTEIFEAVPFVSEAFDYILPFFVKNL